MLLASLMLSASSKVSALRIASDASDQAWPKFEAKILGSRLFEK